MYSALMTLRSVKPTTMIEASARPNLTQMPKAARLDEWSRLPLRGWSDLDRWLTAMANQFATSQNQHMSVEETSVVASPMPISPTRYETQPHITVTGMGGEVASTMSGWQPRGERGHASSSYGPRQYLPESFASQTHSDEAPRSFEVVASPTDALPEYAGINLARRSSQITISDDNQDVTAEELVMRKPNLYF